MEEVGSTGKSSPWASFCMTTYNRPVFLKAQIETLLKQTFRNFEIVISDNDPKAGGREVAESFRDKRVKYESNIENLGMIKSFNRSIDRARGEFIVMVTDDDPVYDNMLDYFYKLEQKYPNHSLYCGLKRKGRSIGEIEVVDKEDVLAEILDPHRTTALHWSSCLVKKETLLKTGKLPDYVSGHLIDHAMIVLTGSTDGAIVVNQEFSNIQYHQENYSKTNFNNYYLSCIGFYKTLTEHFKEKSGYEKNYKIIVKHLHHWFIVCFFSLRRFYTQNNTISSDEIKELDNFADKIMNLRFMKSCRPLYTVKKIIFSIKKKLGLFAP